MNLSRLSPSLRLALILAIASIVALAQPILGARDTGRLVADATNSWTLSLVRGDIASAWMNQGQSLNGVLTADSSTANPIQHAMGCACPQCSGINTQSSV